jgi:ferredoxin
MRIGVFYFTGTGNTEFVARELQAAFGPEHPTELLNIELLPDVLRPAFLAPFDLLVFGAPVLAFNAPRHFARFLRRLPDGKGERVFLFLNAGGDRWADIGYPASILRRRGYAVTNQAFFLTPGNLLVRNIDETTGEITFGISGWRYRQNGRQMFETCRNEVRLVAQRLLRGETDSVRFNFLSRVVFAFFRSVFYNLACNFFKWHVRATRDCNFCRVCAKTCPTRNIRIEGGKVRFGSSCTVCYRCINACPRQAVHLRWPFGFADNTVQYLAPGWKPPRHERNAGG